MANPWNEQREREWREARRRDRGADRDYGGQAFGEADGGGYEDRSFRRSEYERERDRNREQPRGPVFGERETGVNYTGPRYGAGGYTGYSGYGERESYGAERGRGGRYYGDDGRSPIYREDYGQGGREYGAVPPGYDAGGPYGGERPGYYGERDAPRSAEPTHGRHDRGGRSFWDRATDQVASWFGDSEAEHRRDWERKTAGHRGRGPEGYRRSDERIAEEAHERLTDDPWVDASRIQITVSSSEVTLSGTVFEREAKHRAERIVEDISGVEHVQNNLRVDKGNYFTRPEAGYGDSVKVAQMKADDGSPTPRDDSNPRGTGKGVN